MSWKKFGGIRQFDTFNNLNVNSIATDEITIREAYKGTFTICGELFVEEDSFLSGNTTIEKSLTVDNDIYAKNSIIIGTNNNEKTITTNTNGLGINVENPTALLDLSGSADHLINVYSDSSSITTTLLRNPTSHSIVSLDNSGAIIDFSIQGNHVSFVYDHETSLMSFNKDISFSDSIYGGGNLTINNYGYIGNDFTVLGNVDLRQDVSMNGSLNVSKTATINENVTIGNDAMVHGNIETLGDLTVRGKVDFEGDISFNGNLLSGGKGVFSSFMSVGGNLTVNDDATIGGNVIAHGDIRSGGMIELSGNVMIHGNNGIFIDGLKPNDAIIRPWDLNNDTTSTGFDVLENALYLNTPIVIGGNLYIDGSANLVGTITQQIGANSGLGVTIEEGYLEDLSGTNLKELYVNYKQVDVSNSGLKGAGLFIYNRPNYNIDSKNFDLNDDRTNDGFIKVSSENEDRISFRSVGSQNVVSLDLPNMVTNNNNTENSIVVLKYNDNALNNETDNYIVSSSHIETNGIYVKNSLYDINDIVVENDAFVHGNIIVTKNTTGESLNMETIYGNVATIDEMTVTGNAIFENTVNVGNWLTISNEVMYFNSGNLILPFTDDNNDIIHKDVVTVIQSISTSITNNVIAPELDNVFTGDLNNFTQSVSIHNNLIIGDSTIGAATVDDISYNLSCIGDVSFSGNLFVDNIVVNESVHIMQDISLNGNLYGPYIEIQEGNVLNLVAGNTTSNYIDVLQDISINGTLYSNIAEFINTASEYLTVGTRLESSTLLKTTDVQVDGSLNTQQIFASDNIHAYKDISLNGNLYANQHAIVNILDVSNTATITGNLISETFFNAADVQVDGSLNTQQIFASDNIHAYKDISLNGTLYANQNAVVNILNVSNTATVTGDLISETLFKANEVEISQDTTTNDVYVQGELYLSKNMDLNAGNMIFRYDNNSYSISPEVFYHLKDVSQNIQDFFINFQSLISQIDVFRLEDNEFTGDNTFNGTTTMVGDTNITGKLTAATFDITNQLEVKGYLENFKGDYDSGSGNNDYTYYQRYSNGTIKTLSNIECKGETYYKYNFLASANNSNHYDFGQTKYYTADELFSTYTIDEIASYASSIETFIDGGKIECRILEVETTTTLSGETNFNADATFAENTETRVNGTLKLPLGATFQVDDRTYDTSSLKTVLNAGSGEVSVEYTGETSFASTLTAGNLLVAETNIRLQGNLILYDDNYVITQEELESLQGLTGNIQAQINTLDAKNTFTRLTVNGDVVMNQDVTIDGYLQSHDNVYLYQTHNDVSGVYKFKSYDVSSIALFSKTAYIDNSSNIYSQLDHRLLGTTSLTGTIEEITHFEQNSINVTFVRSGTEFEIFHDLSDVPFTGNLSIDFQSVHLISIEDASLNFIYTRDNPGSTSNDHKLFNLYIDTNTSGNGATISSNNVFTSVNGSAFKGIITKHVDSDELAFVEENSTYIYTSFNNLYNDISFALTNAPSSIEVGDKANFIVGTDLNGDHFFVTMQEEKVYYNDSEVIVTRYGNDEDFFYIQLTENKDILSISDISGEAAKLYKFNYGSPSTFLYDINFSSNTILYLTRNSLTLFDNLQNTDTDTSLNYYHVFYGFYDNSYNDSYSTTEKVHTTIQDHNGPLPHKDSVQGSLTIQHTQKGGSSSIVFPNSSRAGEFGSIQYVESNKTVDSQHLLYDPLSSKENSVLFIGTKQVSDETQDNIVIRGGGTVVLDAGKYVSEDICGILQTAVKPLEKIDYGTVHLQPRGGTVVVGGDGSKTSTDNALDVSGNVYLRNDVTIDGSANIGGDLYVTNNIVRESLHIGSDTISTDNALDVSGDVYLRNNVTIDGEMYSINTIKAYNFEYLDPSNEAIALGYNAGGYGSKPNISIGYGALSGGSNGNFNNIAIGKNALSETNGWRNTVIGHNAFEYNNGPSVSGTNGVAKDNTVVGFQAMQGDISNVDVSGLQYNTAIGMNSLLDLSSNSRFNTALGYNSGYSELTHEGSYNTFIGAETSFSSAGTFSNSTAIGYNSKIDDNNQIVLGTAGEYVYIPSTTPSTSSTSGALVVSGGAGIGGSLNVVGDVSANLYKAANTTGMRYTFEGDTTTGINYIGNNSFSLDASGHKILGINTSDDVYFGGDAFKSNTGGGYNVAIGTHALEAKTSSRNNNAVGHRALDAIIDGSSNTAIGYYAGRDQHRGKDLSGNSSFNTCIGMYTGPNTTGEYNYSTAIGYGAKFVSSNQIVLGTSGEYVHIPSTTSSTSSTSGALVVSGGVGIAGDLNVVGDVSANSYKAAANTDAYAYTFEGDETTGIYYNSSNSFSFYTNNTERLQIQDGPDVAVPGQLAIGQTSASYALDVSGQIRCTDDAHIGVRLNFTAWDGNYRHNIVDASGNQRINFVNHATSGNQRQNLYRADGGHYFRNHTDTSQNSVYAAKFYADNAAGYAFSFDDDPNTGIYYDTAGKFTFRYDGSNCLTISNNNTTYLGINTCELNGDYNTAIGSYALNKNIDGTAGSCNTAVGHRALDEVTDGSNNTAIGFYAGEGQTGSYNTFVGSKAGDSDASYDYSTAIGYGAQITENNQVVLGRSSEEVSIPGNLGIGVTGSSYKLEVGGNTRSDTFYAVNTAGMRYTFNGDTNTGIYYNGANNFSFYTNNTERIQLQTGSAVSIPGELAIGQTSASCTLDVNGSIKCTGDLSVDNAASVGDGLTVIGTIKVQGTVDSTIDSNGFSASSGFDHFDNAIEFLRSGSGYRTYYIGLLGNDISRNILAFCNTGSQGDPDDPNDEDNHNPDVCMTVAADGHVTITGSLVVDGNSNTGTGAVSAVSFNATSDYRVKENVQTISGDNYTVDHLRPVSYTLKDSQEPHIGFIAHELQEHVPTAVTGEKDGEKMQSVNYSELIPILVKEIQDLKARIKVLENRN